MHISDNTSCFSISYIKRSVWVLFACVVRLPVCLTQPFLRDEAARPSLLSRSGQQVLGSCGLAQLPLNGSLVWRLYLGHRERERERCLQLRSSLKDVVFGA